jgi:hypothetical protein
MRRSEHPDWYSPTMVGTSSGRRARWRRVYAPCPEVDADRSAMDAELLGQLEDRRSSLVAIYQPN